MIAGIFGVAEGLLTAGPSLLLWGGLLFFPVRAGWRLPRRTR
jgi:hypothetical protein